jgi:hypothetical protein
MAAEIEKISQADNEQRETWREIGQHLQNTRSSLEEPFAVVAARAEIKPTDLAAIERGETRPTGKELQSLLAALKISHVDFVGDLSLAARFLVTGLLEPGPEGTLAGSGEPTSINQYNAESVPVTPARSEQVAPSTGTRLSRPPNGWGIAREQGQITYYQMHACLRGLFKRTDREKAEIIYSWTSPADIEIKVFTSVDARTGLARPIGKDAIRIVVFDKRAGRKIVTWSVELKRTGSWQIRLREKAGAAILHASYRPHCPACRQDSMIVYGRPEAQFWGCSNYPKCGGTFHLEREGRVGVQSDSAAEFARKSDMRSERPPHLRSHLHET